jgi:inorganic triphosphatase YgiF
MSLDNLIRKVLREENEYRSGRYMFFQNLQQMRRQCDLLLDLDPEMVEGILDEGHDWAQDHVAEAKNNMDQVFDFLMNESKKEGMELSMNIDDKDMMFEGRKKKSRRKSRRKKTGTKLCARGKSAAKSKFEVYPSAYANGYAVQVCQGKKPGLDGKKRCSSPYC